MSCCCQSVLILGGAPFVTPEAPAGLSLIASRTLDVDKSTSEVFPDYDTLLGSFSFTIEADQNGSRFMLLFRCHGKTAAGAAKGAKFRLVCDATICAQFEIEWEGGGVISEGVGTAITPLLAPGSHDVEIQWTKGSMGGSDIIIEAASDPTSQDAGLLVFRIGA